MDPRVILEKGNIRNAIRRPSLGRTRSLGSVMVRNGKGNLGKKTFDSTRGWVNLVLGVINHRPEGGLERTFRGERKDRSTP